MFVVAGGSGQTGSVVADTLLRQGQTVRLIARSAESVRALAERGAEVVLADLNDVNAVAAALRGARGAYLLLPPSMTAPDLLTKHRRLIDAMSAAVRSAAPEHVVFLSSVGAQHPHGAGPIATHYEAERALSAACPNLTCVRAAYFMDSLAPSLAGVANGVFPTFLRADLPLSMVASRDVGATAAQALLDGPHGLRIIEIEGPRRYTAIDAAAELSTLVHQPIRVHELPEDAIVPSALQLGWSQQVAELTLAMMHAFNTGQVLFEQDESQRVHGPTRIHEVLQRLLSVAGITP